MELSEKSDRAAPGNWSPPVKVSTGGGGVNYNDNTDARTNPAVEHEAENIMQGVRITQNNIRNDFRTFLRSTLSVLEEDIVENIIHVYDHHCSQEDDVLTASLLVAQDNVEKKYFPFVRTFQSSLNEASSVCSKSCLATIQKEHNNFKGLKSQKIVHFAGRNKNSSSSWREGDLQIIGALNDMISWGQKLRQIMLGHYRGHVEAVEKKNTVVQKKKLKPLAGIKKKIRKRPSTAGKLRKPNRRPPVGGGFHSSFSIEGDALATMGMGDMAPGINNPMNKNASMGAGYTIGDGRQKNQIMQRANEMRHQSRTMLRNALGSYYNFDDSKGGVTDRQNPFSTSAMNNNRSKINNAFKAKRPLRSNTTNAEKTNQEYRVRPASAQSYRRKKSGINIVKNDFSNLHNNRPSSAHQRRRKPFDMPRGNGSNNQYDNGSSRISKSLNSLNLPTGNKNEDLNLIDSNLIGEMNDNTQMLQISPNRPENTNITARFKAVGTPVSERKKKGGKKTIQDMTLEKAALSPWGKDEDMERNSNKNERTITVKSRTRPKSASSKKKNNRGSFNNKNFGVIGNSFKGKN